MIAFQCSCGIKYQTDDDYLKNGHRFRLCDDGTLSFECTCNSGHMLPKGSYEWYSPTRLMSEKSATIFKRVQEIQNIPLVEKNIANLVSIINNPRSEASIIVEELKKTPIILVKVLKMANNIKPSTRGEIKSAQHAVNYIGRQTLSEIVLASSMQKFKIKCSKYHLDIFWAESTATGIIAEYLASKLITQVDPNEAYLAATLCNFGKLISAICFPEATDQIYQETIKTKQPITWVKAEQNTKAYSHMVLGEIGGIIWGLPSYVLQAMNHHKATEDSSGGAAGDIIDLRTVDWSKNTAATCANLVALANQFSHWVFGQENLCDDILLGELFKIFGLSEEEGYELGQAIVIYTRDKMK